MKGNDILFQSKRNVEWAETSGVLLAIQQSALSTMPSSGRFYNEIMKSGKLAAIRNVFQKAITKVN
ncbi:hypothetical protein DAPPUDRAFT_238653 [Daphnia pulex]|uniref:Uncharacterized protein n=1 Tax=Daphnia pulex TaxID=6669 RepID=E9G717_DAPPU|nr:hypothetical protein DAPPUDRAFT_238653 [Daphnia pulex]|eukprot:EFX84720.1 hypothetical protein DAPPUDRAFT_238653 [Daphnia pulex]